MLQSNGEGLVQSPPHFLFNLYGEIGVYCDAAEVISEDIMIKGIDK